MRITIFFLCVLFFLPHSVSEAQNQQTESLHQRLSVQTDVGQRAELHLQLAEAFVLSEKFDSATVYYERALTGFEQTKNKAREAHCLGRLSLNIKLRNQHERAMKLDFKALAIWDSLGDQRGVMRSYCNLSIDFYYIGDYKQGVEYGEKAIDGCQKISEEALLAESYRNAASSYLFVPTDKTVEQNAKLGINEQRNTALAYLNKALEIAKRLPMSPLDIARIENWRGNALKYMTRKEEALAAYTEARKWFQRAGSERGYGITAANIGNVYINDKQYKKALPIMLEVVASDIKRGDSLNIIEHYNLLSEVYENLNDYKNALYYFQKSMGVQWKLFTSKRQATMAEVQTKYETEKKEAQIAAQQAQIAQNNKIQWLMFGVVGLLGLLLFQNWRTAKFRKKTNEQLAETNVLLEKKNAENELLLKEIHHRVKNNLEVVSSLLALQSAQINDPSVQNAMLASQNRVQSMGILHQKLYQSEHLAFIEMKNYFMNLSENILDSYNASERVTVEFPMSELELDVDTAVPIGLIVNELLTNSLKYAFEKNDLGKVSLSLVEKENNYLELQISDNGIGKDLALNAKAQGTGFGTQLVALLTKQLDGTIRQEVKNGTVISIAFKRMKAA